MTDEEVERVINIVADRAWQIAAEGGAPPEVCLEIEALSDDPATCANVVAEVRADQNGTWRAEEWPYTKREQNER